MAFFNDILRRKKGEPKKPARKERVPEERHDKMAKTAEEPASEPRAPGKYSGGVLLSPQITEKSTLAGALNKYVFKVTTGATKNEVRKAIEKKYSVHVSRVNISNMPSKMVRLGRTVGRVPGFKKAIVTLEEGERLEVGA